MPEPDLTRVPHRPGTVRPASRADLPGLKAVIDATGLFPSEMLDEMLVGCFSPGPDDDQVWTATDGGGPLAIAYCAPERLTTGTSNLYLIAVHPDRQGQGLGSALLRHVETVLAARAERVLLVETSGLPSFEPTRSFYRKRGYEEEARIRDFYQAGEDKIVFRKALVSTRAQGFA